MPDSTNVPDRVQLALDLGRARKQIENVRALCEAAEAAMAKALAEPATTPSAGTPVAPVTFAGILATDQVRRALDHPYEGGSRG